MTERIGRYEVLSHLASGGMGAVYLARSAGPAGFERHVVLKMLETSLDGDAIAMFLDEARLNGLMHHQHIATTHELDRDADGCYFLVSDYIHGQTAKEVWSRTLELGLELPINFTVTVAMAAASALRYAHALKSRDGKPLGIVHRDVSLSNLMIGYDGAVKLIDFGIAKAAQRTAVSRVGEIKGKPSYMAPEQAAGGAVDRRTDIFTLGIVLYELTTMTRAFRDRTDHESIMRIQRGDLTPPSQLVDDFPPELERIILTALAVDPADRFQDAEAMRRQLEEFARRRGVIVGDPAIVPVMEVLFENRDEPWQTCDASVAAIDDDDAVTDPIEMLELADIVQPTPVVIVEPRARRRPQSPAAPAPVPVAASSPARVAASSPASVATPSLALITPFEKPRSNDELITQPLARQVSAPVVTPVVLTPVMPGSAPMVRGSSPAVKPFSIAFKAPIAMPFSTIRPITTPPHEYPLGSSTFTAVGPAPDRWRWVAAAGLAMIVLAIAVIAFAIGARLLRGDDSVAEPSDANHGRPPVPAAATPPRTSEPSRPIVTPIADAEPAPAPTTVWLRVTTTPDDATVLLDGQRLGRTPFADKFPVSGVHRLKIRRRGYLPQWLDVDMSRDVTRDIVLRELTAPAAPDP